MRTPPLFPLYSPNDMALTEPVSSNESPDSANNDVLLKTADNLLRLVIMGWQPRAVEIYENKILTDALDSKRSPRFLQAVKNKWQERLSYLANHHLIPQNPNVDNQNHQFDFLLNNLLAILPFLDPHPTEEFFIPQKINGQWQLITYCAEPIELTPQKGLIASYITDENRVFSYGLAPKDASSTAIRYLVHSGTTYPTGQGIDVQVFTNHFPGYGVGELLYMFGADRIAAWARKQHPHEINVTGASLGGSLGLYTALHLPGNLKNIFAFNPAGILSPINICRSNLFSNWKKAHAHPNIYVIKQPGDIVSRGIGGYWPNECRLVSVIPKESEVYVSAAKDFCQSVSNSVDFKRWIRAQLIKILAPHIAIYAGHRGEVELRFENANTDNKSIIRFLKTVLFYHFIRFLLFIKPTIALTSILIFTLSHEDCFSLKLDLNYLSNNIANKINVLPAAAGMSYLVFNTLPYAFNTITHTASCRLNESQLYQDYLTFKKDKLSIKSLKLFYLFSMLAAYAGSLVMIFNENGSLPINNNIFLLCIPLLMCLGKKLFYDTPIFLYELPTRLKFNRENVPAKIHRSANSHIIFQSDEKIGDRHDDEGSLLLSDQTHYGSTV